MDAIPMRRNCLLQIDVPFCRATTWVTGAEDFAAGVHMPAPLKKGEDKGNFASAVWILWPKPHDHQQRFRSSHAHMRDNDNDTGNYNDNDNTQ